MPESRKISRNYEERDFSAPFIRRSTRHRNMIYQSLAEYEVGINHYMDDETFDGKINTSWEMYPTSDEDDIIGTTSSAVRRVVVRASPSTDENYANEIPHQNTKPKRRSRKRRRVVHTSDDEIEGLKNANARKKNDI